MHLEKAILKGKKMSQGQLKKMAREEMSEMKKKPLKKALENMKKK